MSEAMPQMPQMQETQPEMQPEMQPEIQRETQDPSTSSMGQTGQTGQTKERLVDEAKQRTTEVRQQARTKLRDQLDQRSTEIGQQLGSVGTAVGEAARKLREDGNAPAADLTERAAEKVGQLATYLEHADGDRMLHDVEDVARRQPMLVAAGGLVIGFVGSRFLKASSARRFRSADDRDDPWRMRDTSGAGNPTVIPDTTDIREEPWGGAVSEWPAADVASVRPGTDGA
jgi:hypothetical protein